MTEAILLTVASVAGLTSLAIIIGTVLGFRQPDTDRSRAGEIGALADAILTGGIGAAIRDVAVGWRRHPELQRLFLAGLLCGVISVVLFILILR